MSLPGGKLSPGERGAVSPVLVCRVRAEVANVAANVALAPGKDPRL